MRPRSCWLHCLYRKIICVLYNCINNVITACNSFVEIIKFECNQFWNRNVSMTSIISLFRWSFNLYENAKIITKARMLVIRKRVKIIYFIIFNVTFTFVRIVPRINDSPRIPLASILEPFPSYIIICRTMAKCNCRTSFIERLYRPRAASSIPDDISSEFSILSYIHKRGIARLDSLITSGHL